MVYFVGADDPDLRVAVDWARATLTRLGAQPLLERLEAGLSGNTKRAPTRPTSTTRARTETPAG